MKRSKLFIRLFAFLAVLAWSNVQTMACCRTAPADVSSHSAAAATSAPEAKDHDCCGGSDRPQAAHHASKDASKDAAQDDCSDHATTAFCRAALQPAEEAVASVATFIAPVTLLTFVLAPLPETPSLATAPEPGSLSSGPPRYLALERILI